ncbi:MULTISPECIES: helix-turn-helix domain-containing protein [Niastella]|uniref:Helix-turn-helix transcriptional regulator n=1 Tax=Niastella soli TaxID=2821487 RepID=A0ABS3YZD3_9BACT|nr:AraC family transcriptional regulator [Niastella soli]MBO9203285.1 helix-turn-helix transcriptional regulator [Niastella soli]
MKKQTRAAIDEKKIIKARDILDNECHKPITLDYLSRRVGMTPKKLATGFKRKYYQSIQKYLIMARAITGMQLLLETELHIYEIAWETGYDVTRPFSQMFKKVTGRAPSKWRKAQLNNPPGTVPYIMLNR